jgi:hypothetical protein
MSLTFAAYNNEAETVLSKAVKLDPTNVEAWNDLGEVFWKKNDKVQVSHEQNYLRFAFLLLIIIQAKANLCFSPKGCQYAIPRARLPFRS